MNADEGHRRRPLVRSQAVSTMRLVFLDSGPLGLLSNPRGKPKPDQCRQWAKDLTAAGVRIFVPGDRRL